MCGNVLQVLTRYPPFLGGVRRSSHPPPTVGGDRVAGRGVRVAGWGSVWQAGGRVLTQKPLCVDVRSLNVILWHPARQRLLAVNLRVNLWHISSCSPCTDTALSATTRLTMCATSSSSTALGCQPGVCCLSLSSCGDVC